MNDRKRATVTQQSDLLARQGKYAEAIISLVFELEGVSFVEIENLLSPYVDIEGVMAMCYPGQDNIILWHNINQRFLNIVKEAMNAKDALGNYKIALKPTQPLVYYVDGKVPDFPIAKSIRQYKQEHWLPMTFSPLKKAKEDMVLWRSRGYNTNE